MRRRTFVSLSIQSGWEWLVAVNNHVGVIAALAAVVGIPYAASRTNWWLLLFLPVLFIVMFFVGAYHVALEETHRVAALASELESLRDKPELAVELRVRKERVLTFAMTNQGNVDLKPGLLINLLFRSDLQRFRLIQEDGTYAPGGTVIEDSDEKLLAEDGTHLETSLWIYETMKTMPASVTTWLSFTFDEPVQDGYYPFAFRVLSTQIRNGRHEHPASMHVASPPDELASGTEASPTQ